MADIGAVEIAKLEKLSSEERANNLVYDTIITWMGGDFRGRIGDLLSQNPGTKRDEALSNCMNDLSRALRIFVIDNVSQKHNRKVTETLFGSHKDSVINVLGKEKKSLVEDHLRGAISVLTLVSLIERTDPNLVNNFRLSEIFTEPTIDVKDKVDLNFDFRQINYRGEKIVRLVQLKTISDSCVLINVIDPDNVKANYFDKVSSTEARKMLNYAQSLRKKGVDGRCYVVLVPDIDTDIVRNVFGIRRESLDGNAVSQNFKEDAIKLNFLPNKYE